ncbi:MAG TPA: SiaB family protein kinase [Bacteroidales bacterium]|nr:SiaB family protein kinase [Bacteroidales bacterium]
MSFDLENLVSDLDIREAMLYFKGNVDSEVINQVLDSVEGNLLTTHEHAKVRKKVYNVLVESLQNLYHHADNVPSGYRSSRPDRYGLVVLEKSMEGWYRITTCNFVTTKSVRELEQKITKINNSTPAEIKELYKDILNHQEITDKGLGGLGLIDMARKTGNRLEFIFKKYDEKHSAFRLSAIISNI